MKYDIVVIGGGHAGVEAAYIASMMPLSILLLTSHIDLIAQMSCNPAIGGIAKGNIAREVDALGGIMGRAIDYAGIHFKMLNRSKGAAVWGNRAQADKKLYRGFIRTALESRPNIDILQAKAEVIQVHSGKISAVILDNGEAIQTSAVIVAAGTFLNGTAHIGLTSFPCGRLGEGPALRLTESIITFGIMNGRLKTGTSPRIDGRSVDFSKLQEQKGDEDPWPFSFSTNDTVVNKASCWITRTTSQTHQIIRDNLDRSPLYTGKIKSIGPRYCPSIEDKVVRFGDREGHNVFLEPEGLDTNEMYLNGLATSLPFDVQIKLVNSIPGLEKAKILRPGYGIEYDYFQPLQLKRTLESKAISNLFFAGQVNGTSGYEEAACQGLLAGMNASLAILGREPVVLGRETSYTGVLIDDLVTKGTEEPYRMFTSRAEYRLMLRQDSADERLMPIAHCRGFLGDKIFELRRRLWEKRDSVCLSLSNRLISPKEAEAVQKTEELRQGIKAEELLKRPEVSLSDLEKIIGTLELSREERLRIEADVKYSGFIKKEKREIDRAQKAEGLKIPLNIDYLSMNGLLTESRQKLARVKPENLGQASRIPGVTPADITMLMVQLLHHQKDLQQARK